MNGRAKPCPLTVGYEFVGPLPCGKGEGHLSKCQVEQSALREILRRAPIGECGEIADTALRLETA